MLRSRARVPTKLHNKKVGCQNRPQTVYSAKCGVGQRLSRLPANSNVGFNLAVEVIAIWPHIGASHYRWRCRSCPILSHPVLSCPIPSHRLLSAIEAWLSRGFRWVLGQLAFPPWLWFIYGVLAHYNHPSIIRSSSAHHPSISGAGSPGCATLAFSC